MPRRTQKKIVTYLVLHELLKQVIAALTLIIAFIERSGGRKRKRNEPGRVTYSMIHRLPTQYSRMTRAICLSDADCLANFRMDRNAFGRFCFLLHEIGGLVDGRYVSVEEQVAMFLSVLSHHTKNRIVKFEFHRSGQTVSHYVNYVLMGVLRLHSILLVNPKPIDDDCTDERWSCFKGCLGALDGTYVPVHVSVLDKPRYRTGKGQISTNVLGVCDRDLKFIYVLPGWEGSAADARVLCDAVSRPNGLRVPIGNYYLCDAGYANSEGFLSPYRGVRYHLNGWGPGTARPQNHQEYFNMKHTRARNVVERAFGIMHMRWGVFRSAMFYPIAVQGRLIMASFLVHNFIRTVMAIDPFEVLYDQQNPEDQGHPHDDSEYVESTESSSQWSAWREEMAHSMYAAWTGGR